MPVLRKGRKICQYVHNCINTVGEWSEGDIRSLAYSSHLKITFAHCVHQGYRIGDESLLPFDLLLTALKDQHFFFTQQH